MQFSGKEEKDTGYEPGTLHIGSDDQAIEPVLEGSTLEPKDTINAAAVQQQHVELTDEQAARRLKLFRELAANDPNLSLDDIQVIDSAVENHNVDKENYLVEELVENSPYPEVCLVIASIPRPVC